MENGSRGRTVSRGGRETLTEGHEIHIIEKGFEHGWGKNTQKKRGWERDF